MLAMLLPYLVAAGLVAVDQLLKWWATAALAPVGAVTVIPGVVELRYILNDGMAFSLLSGKQLFLTAFTTLALAAIAVYLARKRPPKMETAAWTLILGGGIGNLIDRALNGVVVDYINFLFVHFAVFNFADICITFGAVLLIVSLFFTELRSGKTERAPRNADDGNNPPEGTPPTGDAPHEAPHGDA